MKHRFLFGMVSLTACVIISCNGKKEYVAQQYIDTRGLDSSLKPGDNFFLYAVGKWYDTVKIPSTEMGVGSFFDLEKRTRDQLQTILQSVSDGKQAAGSIEQKVGDFYVSGLDTATLEKRGYDPVKPYLARIDSIKTPAEIMKYVAEMQAQNVNLLFMFGVIPDDKNSAMNIAAFMQGGIGLPDRDYYFRSDPATMAVVSAYKKYIEKLFTLTGDDSVRAAKKVSMVYDLETKMAGSHKTNVALRDPQTNYHKMLVAQLDKEMPAFAWTSTLNQMGIHTDSVNVQQPEFYQKTNELLRNASVDQWKAYLRFQTIAAYVNVLSDEFENADFDYEKTITGQSEIKPRWERIVSSTDGHLGDALGELYVKKYFPESSKARMLELVDNLQKAFAARIDHLDWMSDSTKAKAKEKLNAFIKKIGYPDKWRDYSKVTIDRSKYFENRVSADINNYEYQVAKVGKPVDRTEWGLTPPTINAYYNPYFNEVVFPAGILQSPFFDANADDAVNYGGIGAGIGHEMTHGFDDQGAQYDKDGNLKNWWSKEDSEKFAAKTKSVIDLYNTFTVLDSLHINGALTNGENIADIGGLAIAYDAFKLTKQGQDTTKIDGLTPDQRFFLSFAQIWKIRMKDELMRTIINTNQHSPSMWRVNGALMNCSPFYTAFNVQPGDKMYRPDSARIKIW
ncbi:MAG TPA: M13 family metallopeptidase [Parafilimonas sp.]|nr:M13 family metallopeptidase [Parafilimonas sp.]